MARAPLNVKEPVGATGPGDGRKPRSEAAGPRQPVRAPGGLRPPRVPEDKRHNRLEAAEGTREPSRSAVCEGPHRRGGPRVDEGHLQEA